MIKIVSYIIYVIFIFNFSKLYAENIGYIWFPISWTFSLSEQKNETKEFTIRSARLNFRDVEKNKFVYSIVELPKKSQKQFILNKNNIKKSIYSSKLIALSEGKYEFLGMSIEVKFGNDNFKYIEIPFFNPYIKNSEKRIEFVVSSNNISPFPSFSIESKLFAINNSVSQKLLIDIIEDDFISIDQIYAYLRTLGKSFTKKMIGFQVANETFPILQCSGLYIKNARSYYLGLILDVPCDIRGSIKFVWTKKGDPIQYSFLMKLIHEAGECKVEKFAPQKFYFPEGNWTLQSMTIVSLNKKINEFNTINLKSRDRITKNYFKLNDQYFTNLNVKERALLKVIEINLDSKRDPEAVYFLGSSEIKRKLSGDSKENFSIFFKRNYEIIDIRKLFSAKRVYNAYTSELMKKDRIIGNINLKIDIIGSEKMKKMQDKYLSELRDFSSTELASCVSSQEIQDPLMILNGIIRIKNIKQRTRTVDILKNDINFDSKGKSQEIVKNCLEIKLKSFRFSRPVNPPFRANILFESH